MNRALHVISLTFGLLYFSVIEAKSQWSTESLSEPREHLSATSLDARAYFAGGRNSTGYSNVVDIYDHATDEWFTKSLSSGRSRLTSVALGSRVFFAGGFNGVTGVSTVDILDATSGTWSTTNLSVARYNLASAVVGNKILFAGGQVDNNGNFSNRVDIYDTSNDSWTTATLSIARTGLKAIVADGKVFFAGGFATTGYSKVIDIYNSATDSWTTAELTTPREGIAVAAIGSKVFFAGGFNGALLDVVDIYDNSADKWSKAALSSARHGSVGVTVGDLIIFAGGSGSGGNGMSADVDIYNNLSGKWTTSVLSVGRSALAGTSVGEKALFAGGLYDISSAPSVSVDVYDTHCIAPALMISGVKNICLGDSSTLTVSGASSYSWHPAHGLSVAAGSVVKVKPEVTTTFTVIGEKFPNCSSETTVTISVRPLPTFTVNSPLPICQGESATLIASGDHSFTWTPAVGLSATVGGQIDATPAVSQQYKVSAVGANGCSTAKTVNVIVKSLPVINATDTAICQGNIARLNATGALTYEWAPGVTVSNVSGSLVEVNPSVSTIYSVKGTDGNGCVAVGEAIVTVKQIPTAPTIIAASQGESTILLISSAASNNQWYKDGTAISGATAQILPVNEVGEFNVTVTANGCESALSKPFKIVITAIEGELNEALSWLYPTVTNTQLLVNRDNFDQTTHIDILIFDMAGSIVLTRKLYPGDTSIDVRELPYGKFLIRASQSKRVRTARFVKIQ